MCEPKDPVAPVKTYISVVREHALQWFAGYLCHAVMDQPEHPWSSAGHTFGPIAPSDRPWPPVCLPRQCVPPGDGAGGMPACDQSPLSRRLTFRSKVAQRPRYSAMTSPPYLISVMLVTSRQDSPSRESFVSQSPSGCSRPS